jgi:hypothetical protein
VVVANRARSVGRLGLRVMGRSHRASRKNTDRLGEVAGSTAAPGARSIGRTSATRRVAHTCRADTLALLGSGSTASGGAYDCVSSRASVSGTRAETLACMKAPAMPGSR